VNLYFTKHVLQRMEVRGISVAKVRAAVKRGNPHEDLKYRNETHARRLVYNLANLTVVVDHSQKPPRVITAAWKVG